MDASAIFVGVVGLEDSVFCLELEAVSLEVVLDTCFVEVCCLVDPESVFPLLGDGGTMVVCVFSFSSAGCDETDVESCDAGLLDAAPAVLEVAEVS